MSSRVKTIFSIVASLVIAGGVVAGVGLVSQRQEIGTKAASATNLSIFPSSQTKSLGQAFSVVVEMSTGANLVIGVDIDLTYDPSALEITNIQRGSGIASFNQEIRNRIDNVIGRVSYSSFTLDKTKAVSGMVDVLTVNGLLKPTASPGTYTISYALRTAVAGVGEGQNVVTQTFPGTISTPGAEKGPGGGLGSLIKGKTASFFCDDTGKPTFTNTGRLWTAIGCIPINETTALTAFFLSWGIGIVGGIAFILIIVSGFMIMTSQGNPQRLQAGRELLTAAIAGLLLLIFSVFLLRVIGADILGIPGF